MLFLNFRGFGTSGTLLHQPKQGVRLGVKVYGLGWSKSMYSNDFVGSRGELQ